jgi:predicted secreted protein
MQFSEHERARHLADKALVEGISADEQQWLAGHTKNCAECAEHAQLSAKVLRGFNAFSFEMDPGTAVRVQDAVAKRAKEIARATTPDKKIPVGSSPAGQNAQVLGSKRGKVSAFPLRRIVFVGAAIAAAVLLVLAVMRHESQTVRTDAQHQSAQTPQLVANAKPPASTGETSSTVPTVPIETTQKISPVAHLKLHRAPKPLLAETDFIPLDDGPPVIDGTIVRINMPDTFAVHPRHGHKGNTVPAEVLVDEAGLVRAIRFLDENSR